MVWFEHDDELFNLDFIVHVGCVGSFDIALYDRLPRSNEDVEAPDDDKYYLLCFDSVKERNQTYEYIKKTLKPVRDGQKDKGD